MTAAEKKRLLAERVMGWEVQKRALDTWVAYGDDGDLVRTFATFEPLTNLSHAGEVLDAMRAKGWHAVMLCPASGRHYCDFYQGPMTNRDSAPDGHETLAAAISHAALMANGVKEEEL